MKPRMRGLLAPLALWAAVGWGADPTTDFHRKYQEARAETLFGADANYPAAREAFEKLAASAGNPLEKSMWQARAAVASGMQKEKLAEGLDMAKALEDRPYSVQARIEMLFAAGDHAGLTKAFGDEDIASWPPRRIASRHRWRKDEDARALALYHRGFAYYKTGAGEKAEKDLEAAARLAANNDIRVGILRALADTEAVLLKNRDKAFAADMQLTHLVGGTPVLQSYPAAAAYLREEKKHEEALDVLGRMPDVGGSWTTVKYSALGKTLAEVGQTDAAIAAYRKALSVKDLHKRWRAPALLALGETLASAGRKEEAATVFRDFLADPEFSAADKEKAKQALGMLQKT